MQNPKISIIVPVYNVEAYLPKCLDSLINQTLKDIEIICVNDGSTDKSLEILQKYAKEDKRIKIIDQENQGVSIARNQGLDIAHGEYIMFVDSDDYLEFEACQLTYEKIINTNSDIVIFDYFSICKNTKKIVSHTKNISINGFYFLDAPIENFYIMTGVWGKLFRRNILTVEFNNKLVKGEDSCFYWETCLIHNPAITILSKPLYNYFQRQNSAMSNQKHLENGEIFKSIEYLSSLKVFKSCAKHIQFKILDRWAQSIWWEIKTCRENNIKLPKSYYKATDQLITLLKTLDFLDNSKGYKNLKKEIIYTKHPKIIKVAKNLFTITNGKRHKIITIAGCKFSIKYLKGQHKQEGILLKKLKQEQKNYPKDSYLLFDCLHDATVECIDAYSLFLYMREQGKNAYYVLLKESSLYKKLEKTQNLANVIPLEKSSKDFPADFVKTIYNILLQTKAVITSFGENSSAIGSFFYKNPYLQYIFIQHGQIFIEERTLGSGYLYPQKFNKFLVSSDNELELFKKYGFPEDKIFKVGLARWDLLSNPTKQKNKILIMFTWRRLTPEKFEISEYKKNLNQLLNNEIIKNLSEKYNIKLYFAPHHAFSNNQNIKFQVKSEYIETISTENISQYTKNCCCLITDFSSVSFDFLFQNKPVLFYALDSDCAELNKNERKGIINFIMKKDIMPNIFTDENALFEKLQYYIENNFEIEPEVKEQYEKFFYTKENIRAKLVEEIDKACRDNKT